MAPRHIQTTPQNNLEKSRPVLMVAGSSAGSGLRGPHFIEDDPLRLKSKKAATTMTPSQQVSSNLPPKTADYSSSIKLRKVRRRSRATEAAGLIGEQGLSSRPPTSTSVTPGTHLPAPLLADATSSSGSRRQSDNRREAKFGDGASSLEPAVRRRLSFVSASDSDLPSRKLAAGTSAGKALMRPSTARLYSEGRAVPSLTRSWRGISETIIASDHHPYGSRRNDSGAGSSAPNSRRGSSSRTDPGQQAPRGSKHASKVSGSIDSFIREKRGTASHHKSFLHLRSDRASSVQSDRTMDAWELEKSLCVLPRRESCPSSQLLMAITRSHSSVASDQGYMSHGTSEGEEGSSSRGVKLSHEESFEEAAVPHDGDDAGTGQAQPRPWKRTVVQSAVGIAAIRRKEAEAQMNISGSRPLKGKAAVRKEVDDFLIRMTGGNKNSNDDEGEPLEASRGGLCRPWRGRTSSLAALSKTSKLLPIRLLPAKAAAAGTCGLAAPSGTC